MAKKSTLAAVDLTDLKGEPLSGATGPVEPSFSERETVDGGVVWRSLQPKPADPLEPYPMRLRHSQIEELRKLPRPAEFIREVLDDALRRVRAGEAPQ